MHQLTANFFSRILEIIFWPEVNYIVILIFFIFFFSCVCSKYDFNISVFVLRTEGTTQIVYKKK